MARLVGVALERQRRVEARGYTLGPDTVRTDYWVRYQAPHREDLTALSRNRSAGQFGEQYPSHLRAVYIGTRVYTSTNGASWVRGMQATQPGPLDLISLNVAHAPCCASSGAAFTSRVWNLRLTQSHGSRTYHMDYQCQVNGVTVSGLAMVDATTFLPLEYSEASQSPRVSGDFRLFYGGTFRIEVPTHGRA